MADYGYFGKGAEGYAHYSQTFNSTFPSSGSGGRHRHRDIQSSPAKKYTDLEIQMANRRWAEQEAQQKEADRKQEEKKTTYNKADYVDPDLQSATTNALFGVGMFAIAVAIFMAIFLSI